MSMNPGMKINTMTTKVAPETENVLNNTFWYSLDGAAGALDNFEARAYIDRRCLFFQYVPPFLFVLIKLESRLWIRQLLQLNVPQKLFTQSGLPHGFRARPFRRKRLSW